MAIAFRSTTTGASNTSTTSTISLPAGTTTGDVTVLFCQQATAAGGGGAVPAMTAPAGWTVLVASNGVIVCWRAYQSGDPTSGITMTSSLANWWQSLAVTYSGCDTTSPIDASCSCFNISGSATNNNIYRAPSICPNFNASVLLLLYSRGASSASTIALPGGTTGRANTATGPAMRICEMTLTDGTPTGDIDTTQSPTTDSHFGMSLALKTSGASGAVLAPARPTFAGIWNFNRNGSPIAFQLDHLNVQDQDLTIAFLSGAGTAITAPSGWTQLSTQLGATAFARTWSTGDPTTPSFTWTGAVFEAIDGIVLRRTGSGAVNPIVDASGANSGGTTVAVPALTPTTTVDMLLTYFGTRQSGAGTWSGVTGGLSDIDINATGPCVRLSSLMPAPNPTTAYSATFTAATDAVAVLVRAAPVGTGLPTTTTQARAMILA